MIGASTTGGSFGGLSNYLEGNDGERAEWKEVRNLAGDRKGHYVRMMEDTAEMSRAENPVYHLSISYAPEDNPSKEMMVADVDQVLNDLQLSEHQAVIVSHTDKDYQHVHVMVNRVGKDGTAWNPWQDQPKIKASLGGIEAERGYRNVSALEHEAGKSMKRGEFMQAYHRGTRELPVAAKAEIGNFEQVFRAAKGWDDINRELAEFNCRITPKGRGGVIEDIGTGKTMKLSRLHRDHSFGRLQKEHGKFAAYGKTLEVSKGLTSQIPDREVRAAFGKMAAAQYGSKKGLKKATDTFKAAAQGSRNLARTAKGLTALASSSNPVTVTAKLGLGIVKKTMKLSKQIDRGRGR